MGLRLRQVEAEVARLEGEVELSELVGTLFRTLIDEEITTGVKAVEELLTEGQRVVFTDQDLSVKAVVEVERGKVAVDLLTVQTHPDGSVIEGLSREAFGGAVTTVQSVLLRVLVILKRGLRPVLFLDETLPAFDSGYVHNMGAFLRVLCSRLGVDILLVSHNPAMVEAADHAYRISKVDGAAVFRRIR